MSGTSTVVQCIVARLHPGTPATRGPGDAAGCQPLAGSASGGKLPNPMSDPTRPSLARVLLAAVVVAAADLLDAIVVWVVIFQKSTVPHPPEHRHRRARPRILPRRQRDRGARSRPPRRHRPRMDAGVLDAPPALAAPSRLEDRQHPRRRACRPRLRRRRLAADGLRGSPAQPGPRGAGHHSLVLDRSSTYPLLVGLPIAVILGRAGRSAPAGTPVIVPRAARGTP